MDVGDQRWGADADEWSEASAGAMMVYLILTAAGVVSIGAAAVIVLVGRQQRQMDSSSETQRIEAAATRGIRDARRQAQAFQHFNDGGGISAVRNRESRA